MRSSAISCSFSRRMATVFGRSSAASATEPPQQDVVDHHQSAGPEQAQRRLDIAAVVRLVRIDEGDVVGAVETVRPERRQRLQRRSDVQVDAVGDPRLGPEPPADGGPFLAHVAGGDPAARRQRQRHGERRVAGEGAHLKDCARPHEADQQRHQLALHRRDLHLRDTAEFRRFGPQPGQNLGLAEPDRGQVVVERFGHADRSVGHGSAPVRRVSRA